MSLNNQPQTLPATPAQVDPSGFNLNYFFQQWSTIAQVLNNHASILKDLQAQVAAQGSSSITPTVQKLRVVQNDVTSSRVFGTVYQNNSGSLMLISGYGTEVAGSSVASIEILNGPVSPPVISVWKNEYTATVAGAAAEFTGVIPSGYFYKVVISGDLSSTPNSWIETIVSLA